jgi:putative peptide zinc metalloprotease protein
MVRRAAVRGRPPPAREAVITEVTTPAREAAPRLADGVELIGEYAGSGFKSPPSLARRADGQMIQLTRLLYLVAAHADGSRGFPELAASVTEEFGRSVSADNVRTLVDDKLRPLGVLAAADGSSPQLEKPDPLLALRFRKAVIPEQRSQAVASLFKPLFFPPVVLAALAGLVTFDVWLFTHHGVAQGFREALYEPALILLILGLVVLSAGWHEFGHAAGCTYSGARPGAMGAGLYLAYPAFYTDVTDSYRLGRGGRLRTDLAGVYFNGIFILATAGLYAVTGFEPLLLVIVVQHIEIAHQLLPFLRLDGYYIVADLTGVPDMFNRIKPILASLLPGRRADEKVRELKWWARLVVTVWVLLVVPLLLFQLGMLLLHVPRIFATAWDSLGKQWDTVSKGFAHGSVLTGLTGMAQLLILVLPLTGIVFTFARLGRRVGKGGWEQTEGKPVLRAAFVVSSVAVLGLLIYVWLPNGDYEPIHKGEKGTLAEGLATLARVGSGRPGLVAKDRAAARGELGPTRKQEEVANRQPPPTTAPPPTSTPTTATTIPRSPTTTTRSTLTTTSTTTPRRSTTTLGSATGG